MYIVLIVVLVLLLIGGLPTWPHGGFGLGYWPSGTLGIILVVVLILFLMGRV